MASEQSPQPGKKPAREPLTPAKQKRLQKLFEHATKKSATSNDYDYICNLLVQCLTEDPGNVNYIRAYLETLQRKYNNNRKGSRLAQLQEWGTKNALKKAIAQTQWDEVFKHGVKLLAANPWDVPTLMSLSTAALNSGYRDAELFYLKSALVANPKDPETNRRYATTLAEFGMVDQAIVCWHRVEEALPRDEEAKRNIASLTVMRARSRGEFDDEQTKKERAKLHREEELNAEQELRRKIQTEPNDLQSCLKLADIYTNDERYHDAEELLGKAYTLSEGDTEIREKWEDAQLRELRQKVNRTPDLETRKKLQAEYFEKDLEAYKFRAQRHPNNLAVKYELGYRYLLTKRYNDAIRELQSAKNDPRRKGVCSLVLGQCFQQIKQYRLAMSNYETAIAEIPDSDPEMKKRALYFAGRLAMSKFVNDMDAAERYLTTLAGLDFAYKDVSDLLDKIASLSDNQQSAEAEVGHGEEHDPHAAPTDEPHDA